MRADRAENGTMLAEPVPCLGDCLKAVEAAGLTLTLDGERVAMTGPVEPSPLVIEMLRECKPVLIPLLRHRAAGGLFTWRDGAVTLPSVTYRLYRAAANDLVASGVPQREAERQAYPAFQSCTPRLLGVVRDDTA